MNDFIASIKDVGTCTFGDGYPLCGDGSTLAFFVFGVILHLPFFFVAAKFIRIYKTTKIPTHAPGIIYGIAYASASICNFYSEIFPFSYHGNNYKSTYARVTTLFVDIETICVISYITMMCEIIVVFDLWIGKIIFGYIKIEFYAMILLLASKIILTFINFQANQFEKLDLFYEVQDKATLIITEVNYCVIIVVLSTAFVFTNIINFIPEKSLKPIQACIFALCLNFFIATVIREFWRSSPVIQKYLIRSNFRQAQTNIVLSIYFHFAFDYTLLLIIFYLTKTTSEKPSEVQAVDVEQVYFRSLVERDEEKL